MKRLFTYVISLLGVTLMSGCDDYLNIIPKDKFIPNTIEDYENMLNDASCCAIGDYYIELRTDNVFIPEGQPSGLWTKQQLPARKEYMFEVNCYTENEIDQLWQVSYNRLFYYNSIINDLPDITGDDRRRKRVIAEAQLFRAAEFLNLVNLYAKHYDPQTAATDAGIPLVMVADINSVHKRATVQEVYDQVINDLKASLVGLPKKSAGATKFRACLAGAYALLARTYLFMGDYTKAEEMSNLALSEQGTLVDMNIYKVTRPGPFPGGPGAPLGWTDIPDGQYHPESIIARHFLRPFGIGMDVCASNDLAALFTDDDCRWNLYYATCWPPAPPFNYKQMYNTKIYLRGDFYNNFLTTPEQYLIRAECLARRGQGGAALRDINLLRSKRLKPAAYIEKEVSDFADNDALLSFVLEERRREMAFKGVRHIDLKRLNRDPRFKKTITHTIEGKTYTLEPESANYLRQLWPGSSKYNPTWPLNPTK